MGRQTTWGGFLEVSLIVQMWSRAPEAGGASSPAAEVAPMTVVILQDNGAGSFQTPDLLVPLHRRAKSFLLLGKVLIGCELD